MSTEKDKKMTSNKVFLGKRLKEVRGVKQLKLFELASLLNMSQGYLSCVENGKRRFTQENLVLLSEKLNVNIQWLLTGEGEMFMAGSHNRIDKTTRKTVEIMTLLPESQKTDILSYVKDKERIQELQGYKEMVEKRREIERESKRRERATKRA